MKKTSLILFLLIPFFGISQTTKPVTGFLGIKFGSSKAMVITAMKAKGAVLFKQASDADNLAFNNAKLGTRPTSVLLVKFVNDKAFEADLIFQPDVEAKVIDDYNDLVTEFTRVYGDGEVTSNYENPYKESNELNLKLLGLSAGKIDFHTLWADANKNTVLISIDTDMTVHLQYQDNALTKLAVGKQNEKQKAEY